MQEISQQLVRISERIAGILILAVLLCSLASLGGWLFEIQELKSLFLGRAMLLRSSIALSFLLCSLALFLGKKTESKYCLAATRILGLMLFSFSSALFAESVSASDFGLNWKLLALDEELTGITFPGPMPPNVSLNFMFLSLAIACQGFSGQFLPAIRQTSAGISLALALTAFFGFLCGVDSLCTMFGCVRMPCTISVPFSLLSIGLFCLSPQDYSLCRIFVSDSLGGRIARRFLVFVLAIPLCLAARSLGCALKLYDEAFGWAVFGMLVLASLTAVVIWSARTLDLLDFARQEAEKKQGEAEQKKEDIERKLVSEVAKKVVLGATDSSQMRLKNVCLTCTKEYGLDADNCPDDDTMLTKLPDDSMVGTAFADKFYIIEELGAGGMSTVYKARHLFLEHQILAIKVLKSHLASSTTSIKRFQHEARTASKLNHANIIKIHDFGVTRSGQPYLSMDFVQGKSLKDLLKETRRFELKRFLSIFEQVLDGIAVAHNHGIMHRDLKPGNIMIIENESGEEIAKIVDFGLAKESESADMQLTKTGEVCGSPAYMSPEQWEGKNIGKETDIYSLGCVMYECLAGEPPYQKESIFDLLFCHVQGDLPVFPDSVKAPEQVKNVILACLAKDPSQRPASAEKLKSVLLASAKELV